MDSTCHQKIYMLPKFLPKTLKPVPSTPSYFCETTNPRLEFFRFFGLLATAKFAQFIHVFLGIQETHTTVTLGHSSHDMCRLRFFTCEGFVRFLDMRKVNGRGFGTQLHGDLNMTSWWLNQPI